MFKSLRLNSWMKIKLYFLGITIYMLVKQWIAGASLKFNESTEKPCGALINTDKSTHALHSFDNILSDSQKHIKKRCYLDCRKNKTGMFFLPLG